MLVCAGEYFKLSDAPTLAWTALLIATIGPSASGGRRLCSTNMVAFQPVSMFGFLSFALLFPGRIVSATQEITDERIRQHGLELKSWLVQKQGGFMSDSLEIRRRDPNDSTSPSGVFASQTIPAGEMILHIPRQAYLSVPLDQVELPSYYLVPADVKDDHREKDDRDKEEEDDDDDEEEENVDDKAIFDAEMKDFYNKTCLLSKELLKETRRYRESVESSAFAPYIRYLEDTQPMGQLPATYSQRGKELLRTIQGIVVQGDDRHNQNYDVISKHYGSSPLPPEDLVDWIDTQFVQQKCLEAEDTEGYHAVALAVQRGFDLEFIPIWDMVNHDVRERLNVETNSLRSPEGLVVKTTKAIQAGEEILYTYNYCTDCFDMGDMWGTPGMYRDFGFLEDYPQYWPFLDQNVYATVEQQRDGTLHAKFEVNYEPTEESLFFFKTQLARLQTIDIQTEIQSLSSSLEIFMTRHFYECLTGALSAIIQAGEDHLRVEEDNSSDDDDDDGGDDEL